MNAPRLYLASASPRRRELLRQIGVRFETLKVAVDETPGEKETPTEYVRRLAIAKAEAGWLQSKSAQKLPVLGADTTVVCDRRIMGKPVDRAEAVSMLQQLSGGTHQVFTSVAVVRDRRIESKVVCTDVVFRDLTADECERYWHTGEPADKAGAYGIQGYGGVFVSRIEGSYSSVVGLPLAETAELLQRFGVPVWDVDGEV